MAIYFRDTLYMYTRGGKVIKPSYKELVRLNWLKILRLHTIANPRVCIAWISDSAPLPPHRTHNHQSTERSPRSSNSMRNVFLLHLAKPQLGNKFRTCETADKIMRFNLTDGTEMPSRASCRERELFFFFRSLLPLRSLLSLLRYLSRYFRRVSSFRQVVGRIKTRETQLSNYRNSRGITRIISYNVF